MQPLSWALVNAGRWMPQADQRWFGGLLIVASAAAFSLAGFFTRLITLGAWTLLFWRGVYGGVFLGGTPPCLPGPSALPRGGWPPAARLGPRPPPPPRHPRPC